MENLFSFLNKPVLQTAIQLILLVEFVEFKKVIKEQGNKLDAHLTDYAIHGLERPSAKKH